MVRNRLRILEDKMIDKRKNLGLGRIVLVACASLFGIGCNQDVTRGTYKGYPVELSETSFIGLKANTIMIYDKGKNAGYLHAYNNTKGNKFTIELEKISRGKEHPFGRFDQETMQEIYSELKKQQ